jgi:hypothetical protein
VHADVFEAALAVGRRSAEITLAVSLVAATDKSAAVNNAARPHARQMIFFM